MSASQNFRLDIIGIEMGIIRCLSILKIVAWLKLIKQFYFYDKKKKKDCKKDSQTSF